ncbi:MAG TPA: MBOAT family O-acyltransferase [Flavobacteriaceae bacterium]|nr:MBOAT family protein [Flavobacteriaceae bacterium]HQU66379.1 MBOAT family O-acyltransferase [Flavobacteriaceae bacterium]
MLFNSFDFGMFLVVTFFTYWAIGSHRPKAQNLFLLVGSYFFYAVWDWRFLGLLIGSSLIDYLAGLLLDRFQVKSKRLLTLWTSIFWNLGILFTFKYFNFFVSSFENLFHLESTAPYNFWNVAIPVGLSFYTFQTMSYTIDVYRKNIKPTHNLLNFLCFVSFFPQLVAGPIERAKHLLPQFQKIRSFNPVQAKEGLRQILWGLFKKIIVAEKLGIAVQLVFENPAQYNSVTTVFAIVLFCFQVYCDFSGYTDIAIGTAKLFGFQLSKNFNLPYLAKSISELWQRWHITLTRWFTDYVYIPWVKSTGRKSAGMRSLGLVMTMALVGLWHGAQWTFIAFGVFNGFILLLERIPIFKSRATLQQVLQKVPRVFSLFYVFLMFTISGLLFRSQNMTQAMVLLKRIFTFSMDGALTTLIGWKLGYLCFMILAEMLFQNKAFPLQKLEEWMPKPLRWAVYYILIFIIVRYAEPKEAFIYFQF